MRVEAPSKRRIDDAEQKAKLHLTNMYILYERCV